MTNQTQLFEAALGIKAPWYVQGVDFGTELTKIVPGRVSTETDARLSFDTQGSIDKAHQYSDWSIGLRLVVPIGYRFGHVQVRQAQVISTSHSTSA